jgi:hypothetical protein
MGGWALDPIVLCHHARAYQLTVNGMIWGLSVLGIGGEPRNYYQPIQSWLAAEPADWRTAGSMLCRNRNCDSSLVCHPRLAPLGIC